MKLQCDINLPASKSESNRALMIAAYGGFKPDFQNLSDSKDTQTLLDALQGLPPIDSIANPLIHPRNDIGGNPHIIDIADCGTAARFLTTFLVCHEGEWILTGSERMKQRPIAPLVNCLRKLGADIQYVENEGCLPLRIVGKSISGGKVQIEMHQSSQFASSLLMAAPMWPQGLEMELVGNPSSMPYLDMTMAMMRHFGAEIEQKERTIKVFPKPYQSKSFTISADWSAASYWYEMAAFSEECEIKLLGLSLSSLQGDAIIAEWMKSLGVGTFVETEAIVLRKIPFEKRPLHFDFSKTPDLFPTMVATCAGLQIEARFSGISNLAFKESDRIVAMKTELAKIGAEVVEMSDKEVHLVPCDKLPYFTTQDALVLSAHGDHRVVMSLAPIGLKVGAVQFDAPNVVTKSYPRFWEDARFCLPEAAKFDVKIVGFYYRIGKFTNFARFVDI